VHGGISPKLLEDGLEAIEDIQRDEEVNSD
jgi:hypothetical protein